jgi:hypothetical protein
MSETSLHPVLRVPEESIQQASVTLVPVSEDANQTPHLVYTGASLPSTLSVNTLSLPDGAYDLIVNVTLSSGINSGLKQRVVVDNWEVIEDGLLPPTQTAWFGITDNLEVTDRSQGWMFIGDATHLLFGDADRVAPGSESEYLTWEMPKLQRFEFTVYAQAGDLSDVVRVSVSADGQMWHDAPYSIRLMEKSDTNWMNVRIEGALPTESTAKYIRLTFNTGNHTQADFQLGNAILQGAKFGR